ncbi:MAG: ATP phosphoribosyltransferase [Wendovervirus sonii]|uniref:ATP phosphoribosyltransferase n=1 Tax=phage Lak_Megaphage_Sonny TaxID=3109229 RepID=A0ABZ0Z688_9CAUD|nr:MAG: ATP phosphoribosyltransferase [phage Lak_Megaphage_Sonny]
MGNTIIALPKGRLYKQLELEFDLFHKFNIPDSTTRTYFHKNFFNDASLFIAKPKAIPQLLHCGFVQYGITGFDIVQNSEYAGEIVPIHNFGFNKVKMCLCSRMSKEELFSLNRPIKVATEFTILASKYFTEKERTHYVIDTTGSTEGYVDLCADCIIDVVETGETIKANGMEIIDVLFETSTMLFTTKDNLNKSMPDCIKDWISNKDKKINVYVEGNDGTGKTWLISQLQKRFNTPKMIFHDRCKLSELTLDDNIVSANYNEFINSKGLDKDGIYIILDDTILNCQKRILSRGDSLDEKFHTYEDLMIFRERYRILSDMLRDADYKILYIDRSIHSSKSDVEFVSHVALSIMNFL